MLAEAAELSALYPRRGPLPAVLDTGFIRTGLEDQLKKGKVPASVWSAKDGSLRLFMEYDTLIETDETRKGRLGMMTRARWETLGKQLVDAGVIPAAPPLDDYLITVGD